MKPFRIKMAHQLIVEYELNRKMHVYVSSWLGLTSLTETEPSF